MIKFKKSQQSKCFETFLYFTSVTVETSSSFVSAVILYEMSPFIRREDAFCEGTFPKNAIFMHPISFFITVTAKKTSKAHTGNV